MIWYEKIPTSTLYSCILTDANDGSFPKPGGQAPWTRGPGRLNIIAWNRAPRSAAVARIILTLRSTKTDFNWSTKAPDLRLTAVHKNTVDPEAAVRSTVSCRGFLPCSSVVVTLSRRQPQRCCHLREITIVFCCVKAHETRQYVLILQF